MNKFQRNQVQAWLRLKDNEKVSVLDFIRAQPPWIPWLWSALLVAWAALEFFHISSLFILT